MAGNGGGGRTLSLVTQNVDARFYTQQAARAPGAVLVLGSGDGRIAWTLAEHSQRVLAVDPSAVMVAAGAQRGEGVSAEVASRLSFMHADPRSLRLSEHFMLVVAPQNALGLMSTVDGLEAMLVSVRHHLAPKGVFVFDLLNPSGARGPAHDGAAEPLGPSRPVFVPHLRERRRVSAQKEGDPLRRLQHRSFLPEEVDAALGRAGLVALERYGDFQGKPFEREDPLQVVVGAVTEG